MNRIAVVLVGLFMDGTAWAQKPPLLPEKDVAALANELSGETAKRNLEVIATFHRQRGSRGFHAAAELVAERARAYGLSDVQILEFPADGKIFYGTQRSRPAWDAEVGELWEVTRVHTGKTTFDPSGKPIISADWYEKHEELLAIPGGVYAKLYALQLFDRQEAEAEPAPERA